jgi:hypothetical protein
MDNIDLNNTYWDRLQGYVSELRIDARWILRKNDDDRSYGSLRIVSHPDLPYGHLRAIFTYVIKIRPKTKAEKMQSTEDYQMEITELEVYSVGDDIKTETQTYTAPFKELEEMFGVKIFKK